MNQKSKYTLLFLAIIITISGVFIYRNQANHEIQENKKDNTSNAIIPITSNKKENEIVVKDDEGAVIVKEGEEIIVGE